MNGHTRRSAVLYTTDLEPITVVELAGWAWDRLANYDSVFVDFMKPIPFPEAGEIPSPAKLTTTAVRIWAETFIFRNARFLMLFTDNEEGALALKAELLPGQRATVSRMCESAHARGMLEVLGYLAGPKPP